MKKLFFAAVAALACVGCRTVENGALEGSLLPEGRRFKLVWHDEFDGERLDETKWSYRTNFWGRPAHWFARPEDGCVEVKDGCVYLKIGKRADGQFVSPQLQTGGLLWDMPRDQETTSLWPFAKRSPAKFEHTYGYYECRCRLQRMPGWWSAFWMQSSSQGATLNPEWSGIEHDIMESFEPGEVVPACFHMNGVGPDYAGFRCPRVTSDEELKAKTAKLDTTDFHVFGLLWERDGYTVYIDGIQRGEKVGKGADGQYLFREAISHVPEFILISTECKDYRKNMLKGPAHAGLPDAYAAKDAFVVDFVRVYE